MNTWFEDFTTISNPNDDISYNNELKKKSNQFVDHWRIGSDVNIYQLALDNNCNPFDPNINDCIAIALLEYLETIYPSMSLLDEQRNYLINHPDLIYKSKIFLETHPNDQSAIQYFTWANMKHGDSFESLIIGFDTFTSEDGPFVAQEMRIDILSSYVPTNDPSSYTKIAETPD